MTYPRTPAHDGGLLTMDDGQQVWWEESGAPDGLPALYLHGGPGGGLGRRGYVTKFDPDGYRVVGIDQRGCGRSVPLATDPAHDLSANTTARLIADIEQVRTHLGIDAWVVNGVSWGSTLAIAYALAHPGRVLGVVAMAVTTTSRFEVDWITQTVGAIYPEEWDLLAGHAETACGFRRGHDRLVSAYARLLRDPDPDVRDAAGRAWARWEDAHISIGSGQNGSGQGGGLWEPQERQVVVTLTTHYWDHDGFCDPPLLERIGEIGDIPAVLIHGRLDVSGPAVTAFQVHRRWPASYLVIVEDEGHGGPRMVDAWTSANDAFLTRASALRPVHR